MKTITAEMLNASGVCGDQLKLFQETFGEEVEVNLTNARKALEAGLDVSWCATFLSQPLRKAYEEAEAPLRKAYQDAVATLWKAYQEAVAPLSKAYDEAVAPLSKAHDEAVATLLVAALTGRER